MTLSPRTPLLATAAGHQPPTIRTMLNKVPEITAFFWIIKVLATTVGETAADYLNVTLGLGLNGTSLIMTALLAVVLVLQFRSHRYVPRLYWTAVVLISVVGTLLTDNLVDNLGLALWPITLVFAVALGATFAVWYRVEGTLSMHSIVTRRRESFYWLAILLTFALGTAAGDLLAEGLGLGYGWSVLVFAAAIGVVAVAGRVGLGAVTAFWAAYVLTRPLGASIGDLLSQDRSAGGLGLGTTVTSLLFLATIGVVVTYLTRTRADVTEVRLGAETA
ncbi:MAG: putative integral rane protein [Frankiales bacterium]|jgi:uncharacterized membrane-anchored protein|nr:putative integral rane protein [Frankiales bacterium]